MARISIQRGGVSPSEVSEYHLIQNHLLDPDKNTDKVVMYAEKRYLMTLLVSGAVDGRYTAPGFTGKDTVKTHINPIPETEMTDQNSWSYKIQGRIQKECEVVGNAAVGTPTQGTASEGGFFTLKMKDNYLTNAMNAIFPNGKHARVMGQLQRSGGGFLAKFQCYPGDTFDFDEWFAGQSGTKTVFGGFTTYGERSKQGYGNFHYPDTYVQHTTIQRKGMSISGSANANKVYWYEYKGEKGFVFEAERQQRAQFLLEDEHQKWEGISTMRDSFGNLLSRPSMYDEYGEPIIAGDGWKQQVRGSNDMTFSGANGEPTYADIEDMVTSISRRRDPSVNSPIVIVTGKAGMARARKIAKKEAQDYNFTHMVNSNEGYGGDNPPVGFNFNRLNIAGESIIFAENPQFDDEKKYPARLKSGKLAKSMSMYFCDFGNGSDGVKNVEIKARGRDGVNRNIVYGWWDGMTGSGKKPDTPVDAIQYEMLKENLLAMYDTKTSGIGEPDASQYA